MFSYVIVEKLTNPKPEVKEASPAVTPTPPSKTVKVDTKVLPKVSDYNYSTWHQVHRQPLMQLCPWVNSPITNGQEFLDRAVSLSQAVTTYSVPVVYAHENSSGVGHYFDAKFAGYEVAANSIGMHPYITTAGRYSHHGIASMFANILFNKQMEVTPSIFLRLGRCEDGTSTIRNKAETHDFCDYTLNSNYRGLDGETYTVSDSNIEEGSHRLSAQKVTPQPVIREGFTTTRIKVTQASTKTTKELMVYDLPIIDNGLLDTPEDPAFQQWLYKNIYKPSEGKAIVIHCSAGIGRTGYILFALLILDHFDAIFFDPNKKPHEQLIKLFAYERTFRNASIATIYQFFGAIELAIHMRGYEDSLAPADRKARVEGKNIPTFADIEKSTNPLVKLVIVDGHALEEAIKIYKAGQAAVAGNPAATGQAAAAAAHGIYTHANGVTAVGPDDGKSEAPKPAASAAPKGQLIQG